ncbi:TIGR02688 family protein [Halioglobus japonicus]|uniref:BREX system Lon protease-like protein BrxL n=1 Tax=Halioglobus japonicus TaxID=930805 RepID=A0AAP8MID0_9GAMM|nr:BREX system Lon protease-like protein BrxL [Halioglobus japonicus]AQA18961.1 TIGR02688 family protein [Halioglobus japonicus]PLW88024.1 BREX system Lon protease-like protein BrxL [Halioglobus japonicus]
MNDLNNKICDLFAGLVVRKDLVKTVKGNAIVPSYVLEYLLGQYCATNDEDSIESGIQTVKKILAKHYVHRNEAGLIRSTIREKGAHKVIDKVSVALNDKKDCYEMAFSNLGIKKVLIDSGTVKKHPKLLVGGVWVIADLEYSHSEEKDSSPWILGAIKPIQMSHFDYESYIKARKQFSLDEWIDVLVQSIGFDPEYFGRRSKLTQLARLIPFCERNYNLIELGPKGTGKSHIYSEFSPHGILISGGEVTVPKLFVNNSSGKIGLVGYWDTVAFDEFAGKQKKIDKALVDIMKNYMANKSFSRGVETLGADASMVFVGNTEHSLPYMLKHSDLFDALPEKFYDSAFLDRLHYYIPGWEVDIIRGEMFSSGYGFVVDYLAEILRHLRNQDFSDQYKEHFSLSSDISTRDRDAINKTFSGLMKILFPQGGASTAEIEEVLKFAVEGRKRIKDQLFRLDTTYAAVNFAYSTNVGEEMSVSTLEQIEYPNYYNQTVAAADDLELPGTENSDGEGEAAHAIKDASDILSNAKQQHLTFVEGQKGVCYDELFSPYLKGAKHITVTDPYIRLYYQARNLMELLETANRNKGDEEELVVSLVTVEDDYKGEQQREFFEQIQTSMSTVGIKFAWSFDNSGSQHARHITTDTGWKISLDRGLDIFQRYEMGDHFQLANRNQKYRACKAFEVTYIKMDT